MLGVVLDSLHELASQDLIGVSSRRPAFLYVLQIKPLQILQRDLLLAFPDRIERYRSRTPYAYLIKLLLGPLVLKPPSLVIRSVGKLVNHRFISEHLGTHIKELRVLSNGLLGLKRDLHL